MDAATTSQPVAKGGKRRQKELNRQAVLKRWKKASDETHPTVDDVEGNIDEESSPLTSPSTTDTEGSKYVVPAKVASKSKLTRMSGSFAPTSTSSSSSASSRHWVLGDLAQINTLLGEVVCPLCGLDQQLLLSEGDRQAKGFAAPLRLICCNAKCNYKSQTIYTSPKLHDKEKEAYEVNTLMTMFASELGKGHAALRKFKEVFGIKSKQQSAFQHQQKKLQNITSLTTNKHLQDIAEEAKEANQGSMGSDGVNDITVGYDGTWQKRGFSSKYGVGVAIDVQTGYVIDFEVLSKYCHACSLSESRYGSVTEAFNDWKREHEEKGESCKNFDGSSKAMEGEAARRIWLRSVDTYGLRCTKVLSDGDASMISVYRRLSLMDLV